MRLAETMRKLGWERDRDFINKVRARGYSRKIDDAAARDYEWVVKEPPDPPANAEPGVRQVRTPPRGSAGQGSG